MTTPPVPPVLTDPREIGAFLRHKIQASGKRIKDVAVEAGMPEPSYLSHMLAGRVNFAESEYFGPISRALRFTQDEMLSLRPDMVLGTAPAFQFPQESSVIPYNDAAWTVVEPRSMMSASPDATFEDLPTLPARLIPSKAVRKNGEPVIVAGDSMTRPDLTGIHDGDLVMVDVADHDLKDGSIYALKIVGNGFLLKRARLLAGEWWLVSDNPNYPPFQPDRAVIVGRVYYLVPAGGPL